MRDRMPVVAAFIDDLRRVFGKDVIDECIRRGMRPDAGTSWYFGATENGQNIGRHAK